MTALLERNAEL